MFIQKGGHLWAILIFILGTIAACSNARKVTQQPEPEIPKIKTINTDSLTVFNEDELDTIPEIKGGFGEIARRLNYPEEARKVHAQGTVGIKLLVLKSGEAFNYKITQSVQPALDREALRTVQQLSFKPGIKNGQTVNAYRTINIRFSLPGTYQ